MGCKALGDIVSKYTNEGNSDEVMKLVKNILSSGKATDKGAYDKKPPNSVQASDFRKEGTALDLIFSNLCITFVPYQGNCVYEFQVNPRELLTHALLLAAKATPNEMYSPRVLDALLQLIQSDSDFNDGSMYVISYLCSYALEDNTLSMHDADIILKQILF